MQWDKLQETAFFRWFGITETRRAEQPSGVDIWCKPGGYQEAIDLHFQLDVAQHVRQAELLLDRRWMDAPPTAPFAADIAKSFVLTLAGDDPLVGMAGQQMERLMRNLPGVISRTDGRVEPAPPPSPAVVPVLDAYLGRRDRAELRASSFILTIENVGSEDSGGPMSELRCRIGWIVL